MCLRLLLLVPLLGGALGGILHNAARDGDLDHVEELLKAGHDHSEKSVNDFSPLQWAAMQGHAHIVERLIKAGADVKAPDEIGQHPLHFAYRYGHTKVADVLIEAGADVEHGQKHLHGTPEAARALRERKARIDRENAAAAARQAEEAAAAAKKAEQEATAKAERDEQAA